ncbi:MAG: WbuC family cupin fold metalloprotein [Sulfurovum sp.]|nr:WbuC family cupin fold metalloprotein [Sulfurovum sp.]
MSFRVFDQNLFEDLRSKAEASPRKRAHFNLHHSYSEPVQKVLICMLRETYIPPHYHEHTYQTELFIVLQGSVKLILFDENGEIQKEVAMGEGSATSMVEIEPKVIHTIVCESDDAFVLEVKEGPFVEDQSKVFPEWSVKEGDPEAESYLEALRG